MIIRYMILMTTLSTLLLGVNQSIHPTNEASQDSHYTYTIEEKKDFKDERKQYLFANFMLSKSNSDYSFGNEYEETVFAMEYYYQAYKRLYLKAGIGTIEYIYERKAWFSSETYEQYVKFNYVQAGVALAMYEKAWEKSLGSITLDLDYMKPYKVIKVVEEIDGVATIMDKPDSKVIPSVNFNLCGDYICAGLGISSPRYDGDILFSFRLGARW